MIAADELELRSADSNESIDDDVEKSLKVFDRPLPPSAVRRQRQNSFYEHIDKVDLFSFLLLPYTCDLIDANLTQSNNCCRNNRT